MDSRKRCAWAGSDPLMIRYHDEEWGVPLHDDRALFELLVLEGAQAGLSWATVLARRDGYRRAFDDYVWRFVGGRPLQQPWRTLREVPAETETSRALSRDLRARGFAFVGPT